MQAHQTKPNKSIKHCKTCKIELNINNAYICKYSHLCKDGQITITTWFSTNCKTCEIIANKTGKRKKDATKAQIKYRKKHKLLMRQKAKQRRDTLANAYIKTSLESMSITREFMSLEMIKLKRAQLFLKRNINQLKSTQNDKQYKNQQTLR